MFSPISGQGAVAITVISLMAKTKCLRNISMSLDPCKERGRLKDTDSTPT